MLMSVFRKSIDVAPEMEAMIDLAVAAENFSHEANLPSRTAYALQLCLEEAVSNSIRHGRMPDGMPVSVVLEVRDHTVIVDIRDRGIAFNPLLTPPPPPLTDAATAIIGGRGVELMRKFCPDMRYSREGAVNRLRLAFPMAATAP